MPAAAVALTAILQPRGTVLHCQLLEKESLNLIHEWIVLVYGCNLKINFLKLHPLHRDDLKDSDKGKSFQWAEPQPVHLIFHFM